MKKFPALHTISSLLKIFAWIVGIATVILAGTIIAGAYSLFNLNIGMGMGAKLISGAVVLLFGFFYVLILYAAAEAILVMLAIEENTRKTP